MRFAAACLALALALPAFARQKTDYPALRQRLQRGNYAEARAGYEELIASAKAAPAAFIGLCRTLRAEGQYSEALEPLESGLKQHPADADLLAERADLFYFLGKWEDAERDAAAALARQPANFLTLWVRTRILRDRGDLPAADKLVRQFVLKYTEASNAGKDITDPELLLIIGQAGTENARWNNKPQQFAFILNEVYKDALKSDPDCWQAENLAGRLLTEKHNRADAGEAFDKALKINPKAVEALVGKGAMLLQELDSQAASRLADRALKVNPQHPEALRLKADVRLLEGDAASAERLLIAAKHINPRSESTLARLAAIHHLARKPELAAADLKEVESFCTKPGLYYLELAEALTARKQYARAEECFKKAAELRPDLSGARAGLGLLLMQLGREPEAKLELEAAFKTDPFHVRVSNALKVLKHLDGYGLVESPHFIVRFDPKTDKVQAAMLSDYLERLHAEFGKLYNYAPPGKILVEIISSREMFSGRVLSLPGLPGAAQGASTGPLIAIPSPHADGSTRPFNWGVVVRHELTHAFTLTQTDFLVPIWLTEGLAVRAEKTKRFDSTVNLLRDRLAEGTAFNLDTIGRGYHNFGNPTDVILAYHQGFLYVEFIVKTYGEEAISRLLESYRLGLETADAISRACSVDKPTFERGYRDFLLGIVKGLPRQEKPIAFAELEARYKKNPDDPDIASRLASEYLRRGKPEDARKLAESVLAKEPGQPTASLVLSRLQQREKNPDAARTTLETAAKENPEDLRLLTALGRLYLEANDVDKASEALEAIRRLGNADNEVLATLARLYSTAMKNAALIGVLEEIAARTPDDGEVPLKLAKLYRAAGQLDRSEKWAREALFANALNEEARTLLLDVLRAQKKDSEVQLLEAQLKP